jgi:hypothetical protein
MDRRAFIAGSVSALLGSARFSDLLAAAPKPNVCEPALVPPLDVGDHICFVLFTLHRDFVIADAITRRNPKVRRYAKQRRIGAVGQEAVALWRSQIRAGVEPSQDGPPVCARKLRKADPRLVARLAQYRPGDPKLPIPPKTEPPFRALVERLGEARIRTPPQVASIIGSPFFGRVSTFHPAIAVGQTIVGRGMKTIYDPKKIYVRRVADEWQEEPDLFAGTLAKVDALGGVLGTLLALGGVCPKEPEKNGVLKASVDSIGHLLVHRLLKR